MLNHQLHRVLVLFILFIPFSVFTQPDLTLWRIDESVHTTLEHDNELVEFYDCGSRYYAIIRDESAEHITTWSIRNDGNAELTFDLPLTFTGASERFSIVDQPSVGTLRANEEVHFTVKYEGVESEEYAFLSLNSNDPAENNCVYAFDAGSSSNACVCDGNNEVLNIFTKQIGGTTGILISSGGGCPSDGTSCQPISIVDPTNCGQLFTTTSGIQLFADTLTITAASGINSFFLLANNIPTGFVDENGNPYMAGSTQFNRSTALFAPVGAISTLTEPSPGVYKIPFYRLPNTQVDISLNGTPFISSGFAPTLDSCAPAQLIPTMSEWGLIILGLSMLILGLLAIEKGLVYKLEK